MKQFDHSTGNGDYFVRSDKTIHFINRETKIENGHVECTQVFNLQIEANKENAKSDVKVKKCLKTEIGKAGYLEIFDKNGSDDNLPKYLLIDVMIHLDLVNELETQE